MKRLVITIKTLCMIRLWLIENYLLFLIMNFLILSYLWTLVYVLDARDHQVVGVYKVPNNTEIIDWTYSRSIEINWTNPPLVEGWYDTFNLSYLNLINYFMVSMQYVIPQHKISKLWNWDVYHDSLPFALMSFSFVLIAFPRLASLDRIKTWS